MPRSPSTPRIIVYFIFHHWLLLSVYKNKLAVCRFLSHFSANYIVPRQYSTVSCEDYMGDTRKKLVPETCTEQSCILFSASFWYQKKNLCKKAWLWHMLNSVQETCASFWSQFAKVSYLVPISGTRNLSVNLDSRADLPSLTHLAWVSRIFARLNIISRILFYLSYV